MTTTPITTPAGRDHCLAPSRSATDATDASDGTGPGSRYGRLFPDLPPLPVDPSFLRALGRSGGACDGDPAAAGAPGEVEATAPDEGVDDSAVAAGWPFFGQFVAHDLTADRSPLAASADVDALRNHRGPRADLEHVYGDGPTGAPYLYDRDDPAKFLLGGDDLLRNPQGTAVIGDPRDDVHLFVAQLHLAVQRVHNRLVDRLRADGVRGGDLFDEARRATRWHYQWVLLHDFLPVLVGGDLAALLLAGDLRSYHPTGAPYVPLEFADAAYRYGHSQIRHRYRLNDTAPPAPLFPDLLGFGPVPAAHVVDWARLFDLPGRAPAQRAKRIDGRLAGALIRLPVEVTGAVDDDADASLAVRDLRRGQATALPSGEAVAGRLGVEPLTGDETGLPALGWEGGTPLWYYVLKEAETRGGGDRLGPVGGRIVGEVLVGVVDRDPASFRAVDRAWRPTLPAAGGPQRFGVGDLLAFACGATG